MIFIKTPDTDVLKRRLQARKTEAEEVLRLRLERVPMELDLGRSYDYEVVNDDLETAVGSVQKIIQQYLQS